MLSADRPAVQGWSEDDGAVLFAGLEGVPALVLAVSGGPDSMAMMHLAARWRAGLVTGPRLHVATVDHGLRAASRAEAELVAEAAAARGLPHATLPWSGEKPVRRVQEKAREARYGLLADHARAVGAPNLLTAHHADDQAETVMMRLSRGSGITGLAAMRRETPLAEGVTLVRPLLGVPKQDLLAVCLDTGLSYATDPSNEDPAYLRARLRHQADHLAALGLDRSALLRLARRMARADEALEAETDRLEQMLAPIREGSSWSAEIAGCRRTMPEILLRLLARALSQAGGKTRLDLEKLEGVTQALRGALLAGRPFRATIAGALVALDATGTLQVSPEPPRRPVPRFRPN